MGAARDAREAEDRDTAELVARFQAGDVPAFDRIYARFAPAIRDEAMRVVRDAHQAEDVMQDVFAAALEALPTFRARAGGLRAWLFVTTRNIAITHLRRENRTQVTAPSVVDELLDATASDPPPPAGWAEGDVWRLAQRLPPLQRQVLVLRFHHGLSPAEIAQRLGRTVGAIDQAQRRALTTLRSRLAARGPPAR